MEARPGGIHEPGCDRRGTLPRPGGGRVDGTGPNGPARSVADRTVEDLLAAEPPRGLPALLDRAIAMLVLALTAPLIAVIAVVIRLDSPGPLVFRQLRIGQERRRRADRRTPPAPDCAGPVERRTRERRRQDLRGRPFVFYKFRTMRQDAREKFPELYAFEVSEEGLARLYLQMPDDPRVSTFGRFLRRTSLDELPNFLNVLKGDMALVGPRPEMVEMARYYHGWRRLKFKVKPGITGKAQVNGRGLLNFPDTVAQDVEYVREKSPGTDLRLLLKTVATIARGSGAF